MWLRLMGWGEYMGGTCSSDYMSTADDVLEMSVVRVVRRVGRVGEMCMSLARGGVGGVGREWVRGLCLTNYVETG